MKKIIFIILVSCFLLTGCNKYSESSIIKNIEDKLSKSNGYMLSGELSINNNDENYDYDVDVYYKKKDIIRLFLLINKIVIHK